MDAEAINQHFLTVAHKTVGELQSSITSPLSYISVSDVPDIIMKEVDVCEVHEYICDLNIHKAVGVDRISTKFIKASTFNMAILLTIHINKSITSKTFPDIWKTAVVMPVQKSNQNSSLSNFHPISILPVFSKILERIVFNQFVHHFTFRTSSLVSELGILLKMCCCMLVNRGSRQLMLDSMWGPSF